MALIRLNNQSINNITALPSAVNSGRILQVQYTQFDSIRDVTLTQNTEIEFADLSVSITPSATNSKILLQAQVMGEFSARTANWNGLWYFRRDGTTSLRHPSAGLGGRTCGIAIGYISHESDNASTPEGVTYSYFDQPSTTSQVTYKVTFFTPNSTINYNLNHNVNDSNSNIHERMVSFISAMEIAG